MPAPLCPGCSATLPWPLENGGGGGGAGSEAHTDLLGNLNELHLSGHVAQRPHAGAQLPAADVAVLVSVKLLKGDLQLCQTGQDRFFPLCFPVLVNSLFSSWSSHPPF